MNSISNIGSSNPLERVTNNPVSKTIPNAVAADGGASSSAYRLELSGNSNLLQTLQQNNIRTDKVSAVKSQIDAGTYETDDKLNAAVDKLLNDLA